MKTSRIGRLAAIVAGLVLVGSVAGAQVAGIVTAVTPRSVTVSGVAYELATTTTIEDLTHQPITLPELRPGTSVELEFDEDGNLAVIRAAVVR